ncbi:hypothetical protein GCM10010166_36010 [Couchioplanes caeruleus subsp. azureus]|nr:hypothetical protein GCM10010166_36010 [Couchioplanes caeruleus subsp. azureus]
MREVAVAAPVAGCLWGFLDFVWIKYLPFPVGGLGNSVAAWAVAAFLFAYGTRWTLLRGIVAAVVMLVVAVPSYYVAAALIQDDAWSNAVSTVAFAWMGLAVVAGVLFGAGGVVARTPGRLRLAALALPAAVLLAEMAVDLGRFGDPNYRTGEIWSYAVVLAVLAVVVTVVVAKTWRDRVIASACAVPLSAAGHLLMITTAFGPG